MQLGGKVPAKETKKICQISIRYFNLVTPCPMDSP